MCMLKRLSATVVAWLDRAIRGMENHDAVVGVSLKDLQRAIAETRVRLQRVRTECERLAQRQEEVRAQARKWRERTRSSADDESTALECLRRARSCDREAEDLASQETRQCRGEQQLQQALQRLQQRHEELQSQCQALRSREAVARAGSAVYPPGEVDANDLEEVLERWEVEVTEAEMVAPESPEPGDVLAERFDDAEEQDSLRAELASLRGEQGG